MKTVVAAAQHAGRKVFHEGLGLEVEVAQHFVGSPTTEELDDVGIDVGAEQGGGARSSEGTGRDIIRGETVLSAEQVGSEAQGGGDVGGCDGGKGGWP